MVFLSDDSKRNCSARVLPRQSGLDVSCGRCFAGWDGTPLVEFGIVAGCGYQAVDVAVFQRFQADVLTLQSEVFRTHHFHYAMDARSTATCDRGAAPGRVGKMPALPCSRAGLELHVQLLDHRYFAVRHPKAQALGVALRDCAAVRDHYGKFAASFDCG